MQERTGQVSWRSSWIHCGITTAGGVQYAWFARAFDLPAAPRAVTLHISADRAYKLFWDSRFVGRGPLPSGKDSWSFDTHEIAPPPAAGRHAVIVLVQQGETYLGARPLALLCQIEILHRNGRRQIIPSDAEWRVCQDRSWTPNPPRVFGDHHDFVEIYDARKCVLNTFSPPPRFENWPPAQTFQKKLYASGQSAPVRHIGSHWRRLLPREVPFLEEPLCLPAAVTAAGDVAYVQGAWECLGTLCVPPQSRITGLDGINTGGRRHAVLQPCMLPEPPLQLRAPAVIFDLGEIKNGNLVLDLDGAAGTVVDFSYAQRLHDGNVPPKGGSCHRVKRLILAGGRQVWESFDYINARYVQLTVSPPESGGFRLQDEIPAVNLYGVQFREMKYPVPAANAFACSDPELTALYEASARTARLCTTDRLTDNTIREKLNWSGDVSQVILSLLGVYGNLDIIRRYFRLFFREQHADGNLPSIAPDTGFMLFDHAFAIPVRLADYCRLTGDRSLVLELYAGIRRLFDFFNGCADADGLIREPPDPVWFDWSPLARAGTLSLLNFYYARALRAGCRLAQLAGNRGDARDYRNRFNRIGKQSLLFWDDAVGAYAETPGARGAGNRTFCEHSNALALLCGFGTASQKKRILAGVFGKGMGLEENRAFVKCAPTFQVHLLEALFQSGRPDLALECLKKRNCGWIRAGYDTIPEVWNHDPRGAASAVQANAPEAYFLQQEILGLRPGNGAWKKFELKPFPGGLRWARGSRRIPGGEIRVAWENDGSSIRISVSKPPCTECVVTPPSGAVFAPGDAGAGNVRIDGRGRCLIPPGLSGEIQVVFKKRPAGRLECG